MTRRANARAKHDSPFTRLLWLRLAQPGLQQMPSHAMQGRVSGRPGLTMRGDDQDHDHHERSSRKYQDDGGGAHEDPFLACLPPPSASRDQYVVKLQRLIPAEEGDSEL